MEMMELKTKKKSNQNSYTDPADANAEPCLAQDSLSLFWNNSSDMTSLLLSDKTLVTRWALKIKSKLIVKNNSDEEYEQYGNQSDEESETYNNQNSTEDRTDRHIEHSEYLNYVPENQQENFKTQKII